MTFSKVDQFTWDGRDFSLYQGSSWVLFEDHGDESEGVGAIRQTNEGFVATSWWRPGAELRAATLQDAVDQLAAIDPPEDNWWAPGPPGGHPFQGPPLSGHS